MRLAILLATFNGEKYLREQLDSLFAQTYKDWILYIRDDGSVDKTPDILNEYKNKYKNIYLFKDDIKRGAKNSFMWMLDKVDSEYYMFCDQDDVWLPFKVEKTLEKMLSMEVKNKGKAILVNTDLTVVDSDLKIIMPSMWKYSKLNPYILQHTEYLCVCNFVTGCTVMINNKVKQLALPVADEAVMHDAWIALKVIANSGIISSIDTPTILYRQHAVNVFGAERLSSVCMYVFKRIRALKTVISKNKAQFLMVNKIIPFPFIKYVKFKILFFLRR
ncbi:MAG: glycosyltransferase family 2 protein [Prevotellaceae bacterium]|nr:glycosyltransferase family 2 protein [Prevotellaceae bacterium]